MPEVQASVHGVSGVVLLECRPILAKSLDTLHDSDSASCGVYLFYDDASEGR